MPLGLPGAPFRGFSTRGASPLRAVCRRPLCWLRSRAALCPRPGMPYSRRRVAELVPGPLSRGFAPGGLLVFRAALCPFPLGLPGSWLLAALPLGLPGSPVFGSSTRRAHSLGANVTLSSCLYRSRGYSGGPSAGCVPSGSPLPVSGDSLSPWARPLRALLCN